MITEEQKYLSSVFKIFGIVFLTPLGQFFLNIREEFIRFSMGSLLFIVFILLLAYFGMILIFKGANHVTEGERKWN